MKHLVKKFKAMLTSFSFVSILVLSFVSCSSDGSVQQISVIEEVSSNKSARSYSIDTLFIVNESRLAMNSFTNAIREYYIEGMTYEDLKVALDPFTHLDNITTEGDELLLEAYYNIENNISSENMNGTKILLVTKAIIEHEIETYGVVQINDFDFNLGEQWLFGLDKDNYEVEYKNCKWYQLGCHISNIWEWLSKKAIGGGASNGATLAAVVTIITTIIAFL